MADSFKDPEYFNALKNYDTCIFNQFNNLKHDHKSFDYVVKEKKFLSCNTEYKILKEKIDGGILEYENFAK